MAEKSISRAAKTDVRVAFPSPLPSRSESSSSSSKESWHKGGPKSLRKKGHQCKESRASSEADAWSATKYFNDSDLSFVPTAVAEKEEDVRNPNVYHGTSSHFRNIVNYCTYSFVSKSERYDFKLADEINEYVKRMKCMMKAYTFDDRNAITIFKF